MGRFDLALHKRKKQPGVFQEAVKAIRTKVRRGRPTTSDSTAVPLLAIGPVTVQPMAQPVGLAYAMRVLYEDTGIQGPHREPVMGLMGVMGSTGIQGYTGMQGVTGSLTWGNNTFTGMPDRNDSTGTHDSTGNRYVPPGVYMGGNITSDTSANDAGWYDPADFQVTDGIPHRNGIQATDTGRFSGEIRNEAQGPRGTNLLIGCPNGHRAIVPIRFVEASLDDRGRLVLQIPHPEHVVEDIRSYKAGERARTIPEVPKRRGRFEIATTSSTGPQ